MLDRQLIGNGLGQGQKLLRGHKVGLVEHKPDTALLLCQGIDDRLGLFAYASLGIDQQERDIGVL